MGVSSLFQCVWCLKSDADTREAELRHLNPLPSPHLPKTLVINNGEAPLQFHVHNEKAETLVREHTLGWEKHLQSQMRGTHNRTLGGS